jgi:DNA primase small subunit
MVPKFAEGWGHRAIEGMKVMIEESSAEQLVGLGVKPSAAKALCENRRLIRESWSRDGPWTRVKNVGGGTWKKLAEIAVEQQKVDVDSVVTVDLHRLIRLPESLHGKTGFRVAKVTNLDRFDPMTDAVAFREGTVKVHVEESPPVTILGKQFQAIKNETLELPAALAALLVLKGLAKEVP